MYIAQVMIKDTKRTIIPPKTKSPAMGTRPLIFDVNRRTHSLACGLEFTGVDYCDPGERELATYWYMGGVGVQYH